MNLEITKPVRLRVQQVFDDIKYAHSMTRKLHLIYSMDQLYPTYIYLWQLIPNANLAPSNVPMIKNVYVENVKILVLSQHVDVKLNVTLRITTVFANV